MRRSIISLICLVLVSLPGQLLGGQGQKQSSLQVKVHIEGKDVDALELLQQLNVHGKKKGLTFIETKEGFAYKVKVDTLATTHNLQPGYVGANIAVDNSKGESLFFFRGSSRFTAKRALDEAAQQTIKKLAPYLTEKSN